MAPDASNISAEESASTSRGPLIFAIFATICLIVILAPMGTIILWSVILAVIFGHLNEKMARKMGSRNKAAFASILIITLFAFVPFLVIVGLVTAQALELFANWDTISQGLVQFALSVVDRLPASVSKELTSAIESLNFSGQQVMRIVTPVISATITLGSDALIFFGKLFSVLYITFFFLRDWRGILGFLGAGIPLTKNQKSVLMNRLADTMSAVVRGVILVAAAQSVVAGVIYAVLGVQFYALLAVLTFVACLIPAIGAGLVWFPVAIYFFATGQITEGLIMLGSGVFVISLIDNIMRPRLIAEKAAMPDFLIFLSSFGGLAVVGFDGLFLGPIVASFFIEAWRVYLGLSGKDPIDGLTPGTVGAPPIDPDDETPYLDAADDDAGADATSAGKGSAPSTA